MNTSLPEINYSRYLQIFVVSLFLLSFCIVSRAQEISIRCDNEPLNEVLIGLRNDYGLMLSFDDAFLSGFNITADTIFNNASQAFDFLFKSLPLKYEINSGVYTIYTVRTKVKARNYIISGRIRDKTNGETLPYSSVVINNNSLASDASGGFSFTSSTDSIFRLRISYVGYYIIDTVLHNGAGYDFRLVPSIIAMKEIVVEGASVAKTIQTGTSPGIIRLNHKIAYYLPGNGDNSIFNLLRLQPGITAAGEQTTDLIIWGSYEGQSQIIFDGFTLYGMKNFNDNISAVNPFMAKDIKVLKGGFGAEYGERVGGIVDITGVDGNRKSASATLCVNNMTVNAMAGVPLSRQSALLVAYRQTYYDLYNPVEFSTSGSGRGRQSSQADYYLIPDYRFRDMNVKYSGSSSVLNYYISLYGGRDNFSYDFDEETLQKTISLDYNEQNNQIGGSGFLGFVWKDKNRSNIKVSYSSLHTLQVRNEEIVRYTGPQLTTNVHDQYTVSVKEINGRVENTISISERHQLEAGLGALHYITDREEASLTDPFVAKDQTLTLPYLFLQDNINLPGRITLKPGIRIDYFAATGKIYSQPRLSVLYRLSNSFSISSAAGIYNQFVSKNMILDASGNYRFVWSVCDNNEVPVLDSRSLTCGLVFNSNGLTISAEAYMKKTEGICRYVEDAAGVTGVYSGESKTKGVDILLKKDFKDQTFWVSYTLSGTVEHFPYFPTDDFIAAMQDQRHEVKLAGLTRFKSFHFTVNYVFGSGLPDPELLPEVVDYPYPYSRLDAALICKLSSRKIKVDAGVSVLNLLNRENVRYSNYTRVPTDENSTIKLYSDAVPFTPSLFLNIYF